MKRRKLVPFLLVLVVGAVGFSLTGEKAQEVQKINAVKAKAENIGCVREELNLLREDRSSEITRTVKDYYRGQKADSDFVESYDNIQVYTKEGRWKDSYIAFVTYDMKIKDMYTEVPGMSTLYVEETDEPGTFQIEADAKDPELLGYISIVSTHRDVQKLIKEVNDNYAEAVRSDKLLAEALTDLQSAYEK